MDNSPWALLDRPRHASQQLMMCGGPKPVISLTSAELRSAHVLVLCLLSGLLIGLMPNGKS